VFLAFLVLVVVLARVSRPWRPTHLLVGPGVRLLEAVELSRRKYLGQLPPGDDEVSCRIRRYGRARAGVLT